MDAKGNSKKNQGDETRELLERCKAMEKELEQIKQRMIEIQRQLDQELKRRK